MSAEELRILQVYSANKINALPNIITTRTNRNCFGLMMKLQGETVYTTKDGTEYFADRTHFILIPQGASYTWRTTGGKCLDIEFECNISIDRPVVLPVKENDEPLHLFSQIERALIGGEKVSQMKAVCYLYRLLLFLFDTTDGYSPKSKENLISKGVELIKTNYSNPDLTVADLAKASGVSEVYFRKLYSKFYNTSPIQALTAVRMKKAVELLHSDYNSISAVAEAVGYPNIYHFSKLFKKYYGVAPTKY